MRSWHIQGYLAKHGVKGEAGALKYAERQAVAAVRLILDR